MESRGLASTGVEPLAVTKVDAAAELARWLHAPAHLARLDAGEATAGHGRNGCGRAVPLACAVEAERGREEEKRECER